MFHHRVAWRAAMHVFLLSRLLFLGTTIVTISLAPMLMGSSFPANQALVPPEVLQHRGVTDPLAYLLAWWRWDAVFYIKIATAGYDPGATVFFPLWPLTIRVLGSTLGLLIPGALAYYLAGMLLANVCFYFALVLLYELVSKQWSPRVARTTILYLALSPYALFFCAAYTEAVFLLLCVATFFLVQRGSYRGWWLACCCAALAALTRETGAVMVVPLLSLLAQRFWRVRTQLRTHWRTLLSLLLPLALIPLAVLGYMLYLKLAFGNPLLFMRAAEGWDRHTVLPGTGIVLSLKNIIVFAFSAVDRPYIILNLLDLLFVVLPLIALWRGWRRLPVHYSLFALAGMLFFLSTVTDAQSPLMSAPRYAMIIFPIFVLYAQWGEQRPRVAHVLLALSVALLTIYTSLFLVGLWVA